MNLEELERLAREASEEAEGDWFCPDLIESKMPILSTRKARRFIAACSPETVLRLVSIAKAAVREPTTEEIELALERHCLKSTSISRADMRWVLAGFVADRAALIPPGCKPT